MIHVLGCIADRHDIRLVILATSLCLFGCYTTLSVLARVNGDRRPTGPWLSAAALTGGLTIWATHFVAMLAFRPGVVVGYGIGLTLLSILMAIVLTWIGFALIPRLGAMRGGAIAGTAIAVMHYTGMAALSAPAAFHWNPSYAVTALAIGSGLDAAALWCFARGPDLRWRLLATALMALAITAMHFTAMTAVTLQFDPRISLSAHALLPPDWLAAAVALAMLVIASVALAGTMVDQHLAKRATSEAAQLRGYVTALEATTASLEATTEELHRALADAEAANLAKAQFVATMSHELRTPLNAIIGFSDVMRGELFGPLGSPRYLSYLEDIHESGLHLLDLISDILDFSKIDAGRFELQEDLVDLRETVAIVSTMVSGMAESAGVTLFQSVSAALPLLWADERRMRQIVLNLVSNAIKFTPETGEVRVDLSADDAGILLTIADTGIGIAARDIPRALEQFGQIDSSIARKYEGTGLGLPLAKRLVELHDGTLDITSEPDRGTTVLVRFPKERLRPRPGGS